MNIINFDLETTGFTNSIIVDYLNQSEKLNKFFAYQPNLDGLKRAAKERNNKKIDRPGLVKELIRQLKCVNISDTDLSQSISNINSLLDEQTFTITTGQQLHIYLGPAYFGNKIYELLRCCNNYNELVNGNKVVPVFWLASEDHDIEEIKTLELFGKSMECDIENKIAAGYINTKNIKPFTHSIEIALGDTASKNHFFNVCKTAYKNNNKLAEATAAIIYSLFAKHGIIVIDANTPYFKKKFSYIAQEEITQQSATKIQKEIKNQFFKNKWHYQLTPRTNNLFIIDKNGKREECFDKIYDAEKNYSPNALLRPLFQEICLPNIAYIGGAAEVNYWLQLKPIFEHYKVFYPLIWVRNMITIIQKKLWDKVTKLNIPMEKLFKIEKEQIITMYSENVLKYATILASIKEIDFEIDSLKKVLSAEDYEEIKKTYDAFQTILKKNLRNSKNNVTSSIQFKHYKDEIAIIKSKLLSKSNLQERNSSLLTLSVNYDYFNILENWLSITKAIQGKYAVIGK